jgi:hypothetical protein
MLKQGFRWFRRAAQADLVCTPFSLLEARVGRRKPFIYFHLSENK